MLLAEKIQEIKDIHAQISQSFTNLEQNIKKAYDKAQESLLTSLKNELLAQYNTQAKATISEQAEILHAQNLSDMQGFATMMNKKAQESLQEARNELKAQYATLAQEFLQEWEATHSANIERDIVETLLPRLESSLLESFNTRADEKIEQFLENINLNALIDYESVIIDYSLLSENLAREQGFYTELKTHINQAIHNATQAFFSSQEGAEYATQALKENAPKVLNELLSVDKVIKMRFDTALRLASAQILSTDELISAIYGALSKEHFKPAPPPKPIIPAHVKNNVLVVR